MAKIKIICMAGSTPTAYDGKYLVEYDPRVPGVDPDGKPTIAKIIVTDDPAKALDLPVSELFTLYKLENGTRPDGKPNRPLTAFTVEIE